MATFDQNLRQIKTAVYGEDVRTAIHDSIQQIHEMEYNTAQEALNAANTANTAANKAEKAAKDADSIRNAGIEIIKEADEATREAVKAAGNATKATENANEAAIRAEKAAAQLGYKKKFVDALPSVSQMDPNIIYFVPDKNFDKNNIYYMWVLENGEQKMIGSTSTDLSDYVQRDELDDYVRTEDIKIGGRNYAIDTVEEKTFILGNKSENILQTIRVNCPPGIQEGDLLSIHARLIFKDFKGQDGFSSNSIRIRFDGRGHPDGTTYASDVYTLSKNHSNIKAGDFYYTIPNGDSVVDAYVTIALTKDQVSQEYWMARVIIDNAESGTVKLYGYMVEKGNKYTDATPAPECMQNLFFAPGGVPYGNEITYDWTTLKQRVKNGDFVGIKVGDYKTIELSTYETVIMEVAGIDQYYNCGDTLIGHHIDFISRDCLKGVRAMNSTAKNNGTEVDPNPWRASELFKYLNETVFESLPVDLQSCIIQKRAMLELRYSVTGNINDDNGWTWNNMGKLWLPTEIEVFGAPHWCEVGYGSGGGGCNLQYPIFMGGSKHIIKGDGNGGGRVTWWGASARRNSSTHFCGVGYYGNALGLLASDNTMRVPLCFRIG